MAFPVEEGEHKEKKESEEDVTEFKGKSGVGLQIIFPVCLAQTTDRVCFYKQL